MCRYRYPVHGTVRSFKGAAAVHIHDALGYLVLLGSNPDTLSAQTEEAQGIAHAINEAYQQGLEDAREAMRQALGLEN